MKRDDEVGAESPLPHHHRPTFSPAPVQRKAIFILPLLLNCLPQVVKCPLENFHRFIIPLNCTQLILFELTICFRGL